MSLYISPPIALLRQTLGIKRNAVLHAALTKTKGSEILPGLLVLFNSNTVIHSAVQVLGLFIYFIFFLEIEETRGRHILFFFLLNSKYAPLAFIHRLLHSRTVSEKLPKIPLFGPSLIHQLRLLGSRQHPQSGVLLTSFSTWGTEDSLAEMYLESMGSDKVL